MHTANDTRNDYYVIWIVFGCFCVYLFWVGSRVSYVIYWGGELGPKHKTHAIMPQYVKARLEAEAEGGDEQAKEALANTKKDRWTGILTVSKSQLQNPRLRTLMEETESEQDRISRLDPFEADDCGDGSNFPDVPVIDPATYPPFRKDPPKNYMQMGLKKIDVADWLVIDDMYKEFYEARVKLLKEKKNEVIKVGPEGDDPCEELLDIVVTHLVKQYPRYFGVTFKQGVKHVQNKIMNETFSLAKPYKTEPLEICARLAMEDFNLFFWSPFLKEHLLVASATLFPAGWQMRTRMSESLTSLHTPVPLWKGKLSHPVEHFFKRLKPSPTSLYTRSTFFIQTRKPADTRTLADFLFIQQGKDFFAGNMASLQPKSIVVRREKQTFRRLPKTGAVVFTVKTSLQGLEEVPREEREGLAKEIRAWPEEIAEYKGRDLWGGHVLDFCEGKGT